MLVRVAHRFWPLTLVLASLWGASYLFIKLGLDDLGPAGVVFGRTLLAGLVVLPFALRRGALRGLRPILGFMVGLAALQVAAPFLLISWGEEEISSSLAGILVATAPIFTALLAIWLDHEERSSGWRLFGVLVGIVGVALLLGVDVGGDGAALIGGLAVVLASMGYALGGFLVKRRLAHVDPVGTVVVTMLASAALTLPVMLATLPDSAPGAGALAAVTALGVLGTGLAFVIFYALIAGFGPARASLVAYIAPGFALLYGVALLDESFTLGTAAGLVLILVGSWLAAEGTRPPWRVMAAARERRAEDRARGAPVAPDARAA